MSNNFLKRTGKLSDNPDIKVNYDGLSVILLEAKADKLYRDNFKQVMKSYKLWLTSTRCMEYYLSYPNRPSLKEYFGGGQFLGLGLKRFGDIAKKHFSIAGTDFLAFYGYNFSIRGNVRIYSEKIKNVLLHNVRYASERTISKESILKYYAYENIPEIIRDKSKLSENDFYFAVGDGNFLYGQVHTINFKKREFQILYVMYDEYNWDDNVTYFIKRSPGDASYNLVIETTAFKKWEKDGLARSFLQFFVDVMTVKY